MMILNMIITTGYPVVDENGHLKGFILRKTLCGLMKLKAFSSPASNSRYYTYVLIYIFINIYRK
jgi:hypothetical protein